MLEFVMLIGLPGSGKTTYSEKYYSDYAHISSDKIIEDIAAGMDKTYSEIFDYVIEPVTKIYEANIQLVSFAEENIVSDRTNLSVKSRARLLNLLHNMTAHKYKKTAIYFDIPQEILESRLTNREESGKIIPKSVMKRMAACVEPPTEKEGFDEIKIIRV